MEIKTQKPSIEKMEQAIISIDLERIREVDPEIAKLVFILHRSLAYYREMYFKARESEREAWSINVTLQAENKALKKETEIIRSELSTLLVKLEEKTRQADRLLMKVKDLEMKKGIAELAFQNLLFALERLYSIIASKYVEPIYESVKNDILSTTSQMTELIKSVLRELKTEKTGEKGGGK